MAKTTPRDLDELASCVDSLQEANLILQDQLAEQAGQIGLLCQANACLVAAVHNAWGVLDKLTGRPPVEIALPTPHVHQWRFVLPAKFVNSQRVQVGEGVTERCDCGARQSRVISWFFEEEDLRA